MKFFRNSEVKANLFFHILLSAVLTMAGLYLGLPCAALVLASCLLLTTVHMAYTCRRYQSISRLSQDIDNILHGSESIRFRDYTEGELSILKDEIGKMTLRLREQRDALQQDKIYLADSIADISHQIRTPLTSINIILSLLSAPDGGENFPQGQAKDGGERHLELIHQLNRLCTRIDWLIEALLKISRLDAGTVTFQKEPVFLPALIQKAAVPLEISMELREQHFLVSYETGSESFTGDFYWSVEAFANILKNCMENTPAGGEIRVSASENTLFTEIIIEDNGPGFSKEDMPHLFERFYKGKNAKEQSIGIGLALSRMILVRQNGTIKAENRPGSGARFTIRIYKELTAS